MSPTRRELLRTGAAAALAVVAVPVLDGCGRHTGVPGPPGAPAPVGGGANRLPEQAGAERELLASYAATVAAHPALAPLLALPMDHHRVHARAFGGSPTPARAHPKVPDNPRAAVRALVTAERAAATARAGEAVRDIGHGSLLAAVAAAEAVHADLLTTALPSVRQSTPAGHAPGQRAPSTSSSSTRSPTSRAPTTPPPTTPPATRSSTVAQ